VTFLYSVTFFSFSCLLIEVFNPSFTLKSANQLYFLEYFQNGIKAKGLKQEISNRRRRKFKETITKIDGVGVEDTKAYHSPKETFNTQRSP
jgi:hypothetical protein